MKTLILGGAFGATLGAELKARGDDRNRTVVGADGRPRATRPLLALGPDGRSPLDRWIEALTKCEETSDLNDAFVVANKDNVNEYVAWSVGDGDDAGDSSRERRALDRGNVLCNERGVDDARAGPARDLLFAVETSIGEDDHVLVIDGGRAPVPGFDLAGLMARAKAAPGRDVVARVSLRADADAADEVALELKPAAPGSKRVAPVADVTRVVPFSEPGSKTSALTHALGAATLLRASTVPLLRAFFAEAGDLEPARHSFGRFLRWLSTRTRMCAVALSRGDTFPLETAADVDVADAFYHFYAAEEVKAAVSLRPKTKLDRGPSLTSTTRREAAAAFGAAAGEGDARKRMLADRFAAADKRCGDARARARRCAGHGGAPADVFRVAGASVDVGGARRRARARRRPRREARETSTRPLPRRFRVERLAEQTRAAPVLRDERRERVREEAHRGGHAPAVARRQRRLHLAVRR